MTESWSISTLTSGDDFNPVHAIYESTIGKLSCYSLPYDRFLRLVNNKRSTVLVAGSSSSSSQAVGFALCVLITTGSSPSRRHLKGCLSLLAVDTAHQRQGAGSALHKAALDFLTAKVRESLHLSDPPPKEGSLQLGSTFPRFFPGVPEGDEFETAYKFFESRGWSFAKEVAIDLYRTLTPGKPMEFENLTKRALDAGIVFRPPKPEEDDELYAMEVANFDYATGWPAAYPQLIKAGYREDIWCAFDKDGKIIGATLAVVGPSKGSNEPQNTFMEGMAFPSNLGERCGSIAAVGIVPECRGNGAGVALVATATSHMAVRGADGCFIDWVGIKGFYELVGYKKWERGYRGAGRTV